jgi:hypothetical protein
MISGDADDTVSDYADDARPYEGGVPSPCWALYVTPLR